MKNDIYHVWNGEKFVFTLDKIAKISGGLLEIPLYFQHLAEEPIDSFAGSQTSAATTEGLVVRILQVFDPVEYNRYVTEAMNGVVTISHKQLVDANGKEVPMILLPTIEDVRKIWGAMGAYMKNVFTIPTIALTGSVGKTTAILFLETIFKQRNRVFLSGRNRNNSEMIIQRMIEEYGPDYDYHIQEVGGGGPGVVERSARFLNCDAFAILNIFPHHLDRYKTLDAILQDKSCFDRMEKENKFGIINIDDDMLRNHSFNSRMVTCGITHKEADYVAENVRQDGIYLRMDIAHNGVKTPIQINIPGVHNAYNAVVAFAMAKEWGLTDKEIQEGFLSYRSTGIRQNLCEIAGRTMYIDCFNISVDSIRSCMAALDSLEPKPGCRRIAVLGGENALGENSFSVNYGVGLEMAKYKADEFICVGLPASATAEQINKFGDGRSVFEGVRRVVRDRPVSFFEDLSLLADKLMRETKPGDVILFKGIFRLPLFAAIDRAFGTSIVISEGMFARQRWRSRNFRSHYYQVINSSNIIEYNGVQTNIKIPNTIIEKAVYRIGNNVFKNRKDLESVDFGLSVQNIGAQSFAGCTGLKKLEIPANVIYVEERAFADCAGLEEVRFAGVLHIAQEAFRNCRKLKTVFLTDSCQTIEPNAFAGCPKAVIVAPEGSAAHRYALENGIAFKSGS